MARKVISVLLLVLHINLFLGCSGRQTETEMVTDVGESDIIVGAVLIDGRSVTFDEGGAKIEGSTWTVNGISADNSPVSLPENSIREYRLTLPDTIPVRIGNTKAVTEVLLSLERKVVGLNQSTLVIMRNTEAIRGITTDGKEAIIPLKDVLQLRTTPPRTVPLADLKRDARLRLAEVITTGNRAVTFDSAGGRYTNAGEAVLAGRTGANIPQRIPLDSVLNLRVSRYDATAGAFTVIGIILIVALVVVAIAVAAKQSCPFVYSFDGSRFVFDAEPLGGAVSRGLARTELSRLEHLRATDGSYRLLLRNEVPETQYLDELTLVIVDHDPGVQVFPDASGRLHLVHGPTGPIRSFDEHGRSLQPFIAARDEVCWQTKLPPDQGGDLKHTLRFDFVRPPGSSTARLLFRGGTALWGSNMIREMLALRGDRVNEWYADVDRGGPELYRLAAFVEREQLYVMDVTAENPAGPQRVGQISGGGPFVYEDRAVDLDLSRLEGDTLRLSIHPPFGFWGIDYVGMEFGSRSFAAGTAVAPLDATDESGGDETAALLEPDGDYSVMEKVGDWMRVTYPAPPLAPGLERSLFLKTSGYYMLHLPEGYPEQAALIHEIMTTPGKAVEFAMQRLAERLHGPAPAH